MRYVVYGTGAVGGVIGANLVRAGIDTTLVARGAHLAAIQQHGLALETPHETLTVPAPAVLGAADAVWTDDTVVLLCVKSHQTAAALEDLAAHAPPGTPVVAAQNGVANEAMVLRRFAHTYAICVMLPSGHVEPGVVVQRCHPTPGILDIGRYPAGTDEVTRAIARDLVRADFVSLPRPDIMAWKHRKLLLNLGNGVGATCARGEAFEELVTLVRAEGEQVLAAAGVDVVSAAEDRERRGDILRSDERHDVIRGGSTWQSMARGSRTVEIDYLNGEIVLLGRLHGVPTPANELVQRVTADHARTGGAPGSLDAADLLSRLA